MKKRLPLFLSLATLTAFVLFSESAALGARRGLDVCARTLLPSLLPFFTLSNLLNALGLAELLSGTLGGLMSRVFRISGAGAQAFFLGITGGYPVGAASAAELRRQGLISRREAERLLPLCNNAGPAFILGAAGGIFQSPRAGFLLYTTHVLAALSAGFLMRDRTAAPVPRPAAARESVAFPEALPKAVRGAVSSALNVCAYVTLFSAAAAMLSPLAALPQPWRSLALGSLELGSGIASMEGMPPTPENLAVAAFLMGWGSVSVHCQTLGAVSGTDISCARHLSGRALCGVIAAVFTYALTFLLGQ